MGKVGENILLECDSSPSYPPSSLSWRIEQDGKSSIVLGQEILKKKASEKREKLACVICNIFGFWLSEFLCTWKRKKYTNLKNQILSRSNFIMMLGD